MISVVCRPLEAADREGFYRLVMEESVAEYMRFSRAETPEEAERIFQSYRGPLSFAILADGAFCGVFSFRETEDPETKSISIFLDRAYWGKGIFSQVLGGRIAYAREAGLCKKLSAHVVEENTASGRACERAGFVLREVLHFPDMPGGLRVYELAL